MVAVLAHELGEAGCHRRLLARHAPSALRVSLSGGAASHVPEAWLAGSTRRQHSVARQRGKQKRCIGTWQLA